MMDKNKILITGGTGRLGKTCKKIMPDAMYPTHKIMDITDKNKVFDYIESNRPECIIHMAAMTDVIGCEKNISSAWAVNVEGTKNLLTAAKIVGSVKLFIYVNTACIFPGDNIGFYDEYSIPAPKNFYGMTKLIGEEVAKTYDDDYMQVIAIRTNFTTMPWEYARAFTDRFGTYLFAEDVIKALMEIVETRPHRPVIHICGDKVLSMYDYAVAGGSKVAPITLSEHCALNNDNDNTKLTKNMCLSTQYWHTYSIGGKNGKGSNNIKHD